MTATQTRLEILRLTYRHGKEIKEILAESSQLAEWVENGDKPAGTAPHNPEKGRRGSDKPNRSPGVHAGQAPTETDPKTDF